VCELNYDGRGRQVRVPEDGRPGGSLDDIMGRCGRKMSSEEEV
jgi:hypothetical protein